MNRLILYKLEHRPNYLFGNAYDYTTGFIIAASSEKVARQIAFQWSGDNDLPKSRWLECDKTDCSKVGFYEGHLGDGSILLKSERNG
jgi:hypothetical protein